MKAVFRCLSLLLCAVFLLESAAAAAPPEYAGSASCVINGDVPDIDALYTGEAYIRYEPLDKWLRPSRAVACLGPETVADNVRHAMQSVEPPGWQSDTYDFIPGFNLFQRCHLIGNQLGGDETAANLITGTQYLNIVGMLPIENLVAEYILSTGNHVLYSVWPYYGTGNYVCCGVQIEARSVEDDAICVNRYCLNVQPGVQIDYRTGLNRLADPTAALAYTEMTEADLAVTVRSDELTYVLNISSKRFHYPSCPACGEMKMKNRQETTLGRDELIALGYIPCGICKP